MRHLAVRCRCGAYEAFDISRLAQGQRQLSPASIAPKLRCICGERQVEVLEVRTPAPTPADSRVILWVA
jgi:hypothetical protein